jgi:hypothetical protein
MGRDFDCGGVGGYYTDGRRSGGPPGPAATRLCKRVGGWTSRASTWMEAGGGGRRGLTGRPAVRACGGGGSALVLAMETARGGYGRFGRVAVPCRAPVGVGKARATRGVADPTRTLVAVRCGLGGLDSNAQQEGMISFDRLLRVVACRAGQGR